MPADSDKKDDLSERIEAFITELKQGQVTLTICVTIALFPECFISQQLALY